MDSSIWGATTTGLPALRLATTMRFCKPGTTSAGSSTPRSPRATMTASESSMISSRCSIAAGFSSLAMMRARRALLVARRLGIEVEAEGLAGLQVDAAVLERADPELRALQVDQHPDRPVEIVLDLADDVVARLMVL